MKEKKKMSVADIAAILVCAMMIFFFVYLIFAFFAYSSSFQSIEQNAFLNKLFPQDVADKKFDGEGAEVTVDIDWSKKYPFSTKILPAYALANKEGEAATTNDLLAQKSPQIRKYLHLYDLGTLKINNFSKSRLPFKNVLALGKKSLDHALGLQPVGEDSVIKLLNGYLSYGDEKKVPSDEINEIADSLEDFNEFLTNQGIGFVYINAGQKVCPYDKEMTSLQETREFINGNGDALMAALQARNVPHFDYRDEMIKDQIDWYPAYYKTDHHWTNVTALWAAGVLADKLNTDYGFAFDPKSFDAGNYEMKTYENYWYGGQGRTDLFANSDVEAFTTVFPKYETDYHVEVSTLGLDLSGPYQDSMFDTKTFAEVANYSRQDLLTKKDPYSCSRIQNNAVTHIENKLHTDNGGKKILMIQDSFCYFLTGYLASDVQYIDVIHPMAFNGSIRKYVEETRPDMVVMMYCGKNIVPIEWSTHLSQFDLR